MEPWKVYGYNEISHTTSMVFKVNNTLIAIPMTPARAKVKEQQVVQTFLRRKATATVMRHTGLKPAIPFGLTDLGKGEDSTRLQFHYCDHSIPIAPHVFLWLCVAFARPPNKNLAFLWSPAEYSWCSGWGLPGVEVEFLVLLHGLPIDSHVFI